MLKTEVLRERTRERPRVVVVTCATRCAAHMRDSERQVSGAEHAKRDSCLTGRVPSGMSGQVTATYGSTDRRFDRKSISLAYGTMSTTAIHGATPPHSSAAAPREPRIGCPRVPRMAPPWPGVSAAGAAVVAAVGSGASGVSPRGHHCWTRRGTRLPLGNTEDGHPGLSTKHARTQ